MQCDQIRQYLTQYAEGALPGYKVAWVVQHLAGCEACTAEAERAKRTRQQARTGPEPAPWQPAVRGQPVAGAREQRSENGFEAVQRPVPRWLQLATVILIAAAAGGALWLFLDHPHSTPSPRGHVSTKMVPYFSRLES